jgi:hypothetical protein
MRKFDNGFDFRRVRNYHPVAQRIARAAAVARFRRADKCAPNDDQNVVSDDKPREACETPRAFICIRNVFHVREKRNFDFSLTQAAVFHLSRRAKMF